MVEKNHRLFLRNLPIDIDEKNLQNFFGEYGTVTNIDVKDKTGSDGSKIAFLNITTTDLRLNTCFRLAQEKSFQGRVIQVQLAKESYLDRLKRERQEAAAAAAAAAAESARPSGVLAPGNGVVDRQIEKINIKVPAGVQSRSTKKKYDFEDVPDNGLERPDFSWDPALQERNVLADNKLEREPSHSPRPPVEKPKEKVLLQSEIKRLASVKEKRQTFKLHGKLITRALKAVDSSGGRNKIIFSQHDDPMVPDGEKTAAVVSLFDNEDNSDDDDDEEGGPRVDKFEHDEARYAKMKLSLSNRNGDKRFAMDERFLDDTAEAKDDEKVASEYNETKWQLDILENVLGKPLAGRKDQSGEKKENKMIRYDPTSGCHRNHELVMKKPAIREKKAKFTRVLEQEEQAPPLPVSSEIFYEVSKNLTESLNTRGEFSLLKSFGSAAPPNDKNNTSDYVGASVAAAAVGEKEYGMKDAFKYESSSDEEGPSMHSDEIVARSNTKSETIADTFFFVIDDPRFREAEEFFKTRAPTGDGADFTNVRRQLKQIVRSKIRNNARKNTRWRNSKVVKRPNIR